MITKIHMEAVASFKHATSLVTDKKINLVYGLNGTGKSTISNFLYEPQHVTFSMCKQVLANSVPVLVYNQKFIQDNFFAVDSLKGIFSLSKENKAAANKIADATKRKEELDQTLQVKRSEIERAKNSFSYQKQQAIDEVWSIKQNYAGGDQVLEYCLEDLKGQKNKLFSYLQGISKPSNEPKKNIQTIHQEVEALKGDSAQPQQLLTTYTFNAHGVEKDPIFGKSILGNTDSEVAALIEKFGNSDWVEQGFAYLPEDAGNSSAQCPFCQQETISDKFIDTIRSYFDVSYQQQLSKLEQLLHAYQSAVKELPELTSYIDHAFAQKYKDLISRKYGLIVDTFKDNVRKIEEKLKNPRAPVVLTHTSDVIVDFNLKIDQVNTEIEAYNNRLKNSASALEILKNEFWELMRWQYDQTMARFEADRQDFNQCLMILNAEVGSIDGALVKVKEEIAEAQKQTMNVEQAVAAINEGLLDLGIDDFSVKKHKDSLYRVVREGGSEDVFHSLSEGEKMIK